MPASPRFLVDVVIAVHRTDRPLDRAVASVFEAGLPVGEEGGVRIVVVCHNIDPERIREVLRPQFRDRVTYLERRDGGRTPGEPRNHALDHADARYVCFLDSDDTLDPGAIARWAGIAREHGSAAVLARVSYADGKVLRAPVTRPWRAKDLDALKDRLVYRTRVVGLLSIPAIERLGLRFPEGFAAGEDQSFSLVLYTDGGRVDYARGAPGYRLREDVEGRISDTVKPLSDELDPFLAFSASEWLQSQSLPFRRSYAVKVLRIRVFDEVTTRTRRGAWSAQDAETARRAVRQLLADAPGAERVLSRADRDLLDLLERGEADPAAVTRAAQARRRFGAPATLVPRDLARTFHRDGSLRFMAAAALMS